VTNNRLFWVDMETMGLDPTTDFVLEFGCIVTNLALEPLSQERWLLWDYPSYDQRWAKEDKTGIVANMHRKSGLIQDAYSAGVPSSTAWSEIAQWLINEGLTREDPLCGNSVRLDRAFLNHYAPQIDLLFHYRIIDVSSVKELCRRYRPDIYGKLEAEASKHEVHRVIPDLKDTLGEFKFYRDNFLKVK
jgi:oligoribonuclease